MKALKMKALVLTVALTVGAITWGRNIAKDGTDPNTFAGNTNKFLKERQDIRADLRNIEQDKADIVHYKAELKADRKADRKMEVIVDKKELKKAKADLKRDKTYLCADKQDLRRDHRLGIREERENVKETRMALNDAKRQLRKDLRNDNGVLIKEDAATVTYYMVKHDASKMALNELKVDRDEEMVAVNAEIRESNQFGTAYGVAGQAQANR